MEPYNGKVVRISTPDQAKDDISNYILCKKHSNEMATNDWGFNYGGPFRNLKLRRHVSHAIPVENEEV